MRFIWTLLAITTMGCSSWQVPSSLDVLNAICENEVAQELLSENPSLPAEVAVLFAQNVCETLSYDPGLGEVLAAADKARTPRGRALVNEARARGAL